MSTQKRIVLVGGGSGGHFYPLIAIAESIRGIEKNKALLYYMGPNPYDSEALNAYDITFISCPAGKRRRYRSVMNIIDPFITLYGLIIAVFKLFFYYPDVIMSKGGYTSVPVVLASWFLRIPIVIHESDSKPGRANALAARFAKYIAVSYIDAADYFPKEKTLFTGIPIRKPLLSPAGSTPLDIEISNKKPMILILGGSQGAERVNELVLETLDELLPKFTIVHQTGKDHFDVIKESAEQLIADKELLKSYYPLAFVSESTLNELMHHAVVIISRAGSGTIYEIAAHKKPSILIPIPEDISHDQRGNAYAYARTGAGAVMEEKNLRDGLLVAEINRIMGDPKMYASISDSASSFSVTDAAETLAAVLLEIGRTHE